MGSQRWFSFSTDFRPHDSHGFSLPTILLNAFIILAIKQRKELQKPSNILLSSLAVTDLLVGAIAMPTSAIIDFFTFRQVSFEYN